MENRRLQLRVGLDRDRDRAAGNIAIRTGKRLEWNGEQGQFAGPKDANNT